MCSTNAVGVCDKEVQTFVFFDLETTGINNKPQITELSMIAVSRKHLLSVKEDSDMFPNSYKCSPPSLPRVVHKFTRLYYPRTFIHPSVEDITGLSNELLQHLASFTSESVQALKLFLNLPLPICLVAHNGNGFDFPVLRAELIRCDSDILGDVLCADSLLFARQYEAEDIRIATEIAMGFKEDDAPIIPKESPLLSNSDIPSEPLLIIGNRPSNFSEDFNPLPGYSTPKKMISNVLAKTPTTPVKDNGFPVNGLVTPGQSPISQSIMIQSLNSGACRTLNYDNVDSGEERKKRPFSQPNIYQKIFRTKYDAHRAEDDAVALLQICSFHGYHFVNWVDKNCKPFSSFEPKWRVRKSFAI